MNFSQRKFQESTQIQQHKQAASLLRRMYEKAIPIDIRNYATMCQCLDLPALDISLESIADRFHYHNEKTEHGLNEPHFLPRVEKTDREHPLADPLPIAIYLDKIRSTHNIGSIIRTCEALSLGSLYFSDQMAFTDSKQVVDTSMGSLPHVPCYRNVPLESLPRPIIALETTTNAHDLYSFSFPSHFTLILGNEEYGCSENSLRTADVFVKIPQYGRKNSLNVANAFAVVAYEIRKQVHSPTKVLTLRSRIPCPHP